MPHYRDMTDEEGAAIVAYLRALPPVHRQIPESQCADEPAVVASDAAADAPDAGDSDATSAVCTGWADPGTAAACHACRARACQANGCVGGFWCDTTARHCHSPPDCGAPGG
jgi:hypothetical protein